MGSWHPPYHFIAPGKLNSDRDTRIYILVGRDDRKIRPIFGLIGQKIVVFFGYIDRKISGHVKVYFRNMSHTLYPYNA